MASKAIFGVLSFFWCRALGASSIFGTGRELCFVTDCQALMVLQSELEILPRVDAGFNLFEESAKPNQRNQAFDRAGGPRRLSKPSSFKTEFIFHRLLSVLNRPAGARSTAPA
jgi:hypothetical protein